MKTRDELNSLSAVNDPNRFRAERIKHNRVTSNVYCASSQFITCVTTEAIFLIYFEAELQAVSVDIFQACGIHVRF